MFDMFNHSTIWASLLGVVLIIFYRVFLQPDNLPPGLPIVGAKKGDWHPLLQAAWRNTLDFKKAANTSYRLYKDRPAILPTFDSGRVVLLPVSDIQFVADQPDDVLSMHASTQDLLQTDLTTADPSLTHDPIHLELVGSVLTREIPNLIVPVLDEIDYCFSQVWGADPEYHEVKVLGSMQQIISGITNRVFVGLPLCRNKEVLAMAMAFAQDVPLTSTVIRLFPTILRPWVAPFITIPNRIHTKKFIKLLKPEIEARLAKYDALHGDNSPDEKTHTYEHNDLLQWAIVQAKEIGDPKNWTIDALANRVLLLNFAAIHTSSFAITHALLDLAAAPTEVTTILRREVEQVLRDNDGVWSKRAVSQMERLDAVMRESHRRNSFVILSVVRKVMAKEGVTFPCGVHVAKDRIICSAAYGIHQDANKFPQPETFQPWRFYSEKATDTSENSLAAPRKAYSTASKEFLGWGLGKTACPGRFFASNEIKCMVAYTLLNYDIKPLDARPGNTWLGNNRIPPTDATLWVKRRV